MNLNLILGSTLLFVVSSITIYQIGYQKGYRSAQIRYQNEIQEQTIKHIEITKNVITEWKEREASLVTNYLKRIEILKEEHKHEIDSIQSNQLSDTVIPECLQSANSNPTQELPKAPKAGSNSICYSEADILRKVKESMAIAEECDELAHRYNTLLEVVQTYTGESPSG